MKKIRKIAKKLPTLGEDVNLRNWKHLIFISFFILYVFFLLYLFYVNKTYVASSIAADSTSSATLVTNKVALDLYPQHYLLLNNPNLWLQKLTDSYNAYQDLTGAVPFNGAVITIKEYPADQMSGAEMYAGNPIRWLDSSVPGKLKNVNDHNDLSFGPIHELGHDFDVYFSSLKYLAGSAPILSVEQWANFKLTYVADTLAKKYPSATFYGGSIGFVPIGEFSKRYFEDIFAKEWLNSPKNNWQTMKSDAYTGLLHFLTRKYGWDIFKKTFRDYLTLIPIPKDDIQKINLFVYLLSKNSGADIKQEFINFGIPVSDYEPLSTAPAGYTYCGSDPSICSFNGAASVAFGANGKFVYKTFVNTAYCNSFYFDVTPTPGVTNLCFYRITSLIPTPSSVPIPSSALTPTPTSSPSANLDSDGDGFSNAIENYIGTNPNKACITDLVNDVEASKSGKPSKTWPADLNTTAGAINSFNKINIMDLTSFTSPIRKLDAKVGDAGYDKRWDLNADGKIDIVDLTSVKVTAPPMLNNVRAFNGPPCPVP